MINFTFNSHSLTLLNTLNLEQPSFISKEREESAIEQGEHFVCVYMCMCVQNSLFAFYLT